MSGSRLNPSASLKAKDLPKTVLRRAGLSRARLASARMWYERNAMAELRRGSIGPVRPRILCYHSIGTPEWGVNDVTPRQFAQHVETALEMGHRFVPASVIADGEGEPQDLAVTFDDGLTSIKNAVPLLKAYRIPASVFVVTNWADGCSPFPGVSMLSWRDIETMASDGVTIGSHSVTHPNFAKLDAEIAAEELERSRAVIAARTGINADEFAVPFGQSSDWHPALTLTARSVGYRNIYAQSEGRRTAGTAPRTFVSRWDRPKVFAAALQGRFDSWEEWI